MATVNYSIPEDIRAAFNEAFAGQNKSAVIAGLMREAIDRARAEVDSRAAISRIAGRRAIAPIRSIHTLKTARQLGRP